MVSSPFHVGFTRGFESGQMAPEALTLLETHGITRGYFAVADGEVHAQDITEYDAVALLGERFGTPALRGNARLVAVARWGVGYDAVDLDACTAHDVCVFITPNGVRRPVAVAILTFLLALALRVRAKDVLVRQVEWGRKTEFMGEMLTGKVLGSLGFGNIARELFRLAAPLEMRHIAHDPYVPDAVAAAAGVRLVDKETLLREADVLCINCALTPETRHSIGAAELAMMKPAAYLINTARGPIVDEAALVDALRAGRLRGAGLDVFEREPLPADSPLLAMENVLLAPHALAWTDELVLGISMDDAHGLMRLACGEAPDAVVNREVLERPGFQRKLRALAERHAAMNEVREIP
jgi:phosphoglycerate dehydrogenase-like enzyme